MDLIIGVYSASIVFAGTLALAASCFLVYRCMKNRWQRNQLKEHMLMKKHQYATQIGTSVL
jgi:hypothetical protein